MRGSSESKTIRVKCEVLRVEIHVQEILFQNLYPMLPLTTARHLVPSIIQVEAPAKLLARGPQFTRADKHDRLRMDSS